LGPSEQKKLRTNTVNADVFCASEAQNHGIQLVSTSLTPTFFLA
jgi:hypothetical protein